VWLCLLGVGVCRVVLVEGGKVGEWIDLIPNDEFGTRIWNL
jgi:hypothetical protein